MKTRNNKLKNRRNKSKRRGGAVPNESVTNESVTFMASIGDSEDSNVTLNYDGDKEYSISNTEAELDNAEIVGAKVNSNYEYTVTIKPIDGPPKDLNLKIKDGDANRDKANSMLIKAGANAITNKLKSSQSDTEMREDNEGETESNKVSVDSVIEGNEPPAGPPLVATKVPTIVAESDPIFSDATEGTPVPPGNTGCPKIMDCAKRALEVIKECKDEPTDAKAGGGKKQTKKKRRRRRKTKHLKKKKRSKRRKLKKRKSRKH
tara:strand:+ start:5986 stop:6771 length:786 start_codon:yes stop_codon:yes gene_type:complete